VGKSYDTGFAPTIEKITVEIVVAVVTGERWA
jgi:hypothetical protein